MRMENTVRYTPWAVSKSQNGNEAVRRQNFIKTWDGITMDEQRFHVKERIMGRSYD